MAFDRQQRSFIDPAVLAQLSVLPLRSRRPMLGSVSGRHSSPHRGASVEFAEYRKYVPGDDLRRLDWRAYGRSDRFYIKEFEADTNLRLVMVLDTSGSMAAAHQGISKIDYARRLAGALSYLAIQQGDAVGLACVEQGLIHQIPPRRNPAHLSILFDHLEVVKAQGTTGLPQVLHELAETVRQRALVVILSDLFMQPAELRECFEHLRFRKHDVAAFHLLNPDEIHFSFQRPTRFLDMEGGPAIFADPVEIAQRYLQAIQQYLEELRQVVLETAVDYRRVVLDQPYDQALRSFLVDRANLRRSR
ncbi:MAG TPA: DUF58 domain-containing protein [Planctomycetaceae bacterium]|nr:DUF58 domain-containing protein [Planctomycetaceae bacterium]